ncbi:MAG TPA: patatin-like phospholipase family protein [Anaerolineales bacterium]|nr:patatin-like phospholipase family protein [Anaerolineales bacterium]
MKPFRKNVAIAIDGGGIRGIIPARALMMLEEELGKTSHKIFRLCVGTSTGSVLAAGIAKGLSAEQMFRLYQHLGNHIFKKTLRSRLWFAMTFRYPGKSLEEALRKNLGTGDIGELWKQKPPTDLVVTAFDMIENRTRFIKSWKPEYQHWPLVKAVLASAAAPTYFPVVDGHFVDGGVGSFNNPCFLAAYELQFCLNWKPEDTTLISLGTGRAPKSYKFGQAERFRPIHWLAPLLDGFAGSAGDQQVHLVDTFFRGLDFRRFQVDMDRPISLDKPEEIPNLIKYGEAMGAMILKDKRDRAQKIAPSRPRLQPKRSPKPKAAK